MMASSPSQVSGQHVPVLHTESLNALNLSGDECVVDATFGRGGHSRSILDRLSSRGRLIAFDRDATAVQAATREFGQDERFTIIHAPFSELLSVLEALGLVGKVDALLFDFGVSSPQLDDPDRGFSFMQDGPLDMRMDQSRGLSAAVWLERVEESDLVWVLKRYGEERFARRIAKGIKTALTDEPIVTTGRLAKIIDQAIPFKEKGKHPATRSFQAIRIAVNDELSEIESVLPQALEVVAPRGRIVVISFHSLEDRLVKRFFKEHAKGDPYPPDLPVTQDMLAPKIRIVGKPVKAGDFELEHNRRARSAVMRIAEKGE